MTPPRFEVERVTDPAYGCWWCPHGVAARWRETMTLCNGRIRRVYACDQHVRGKR